MNDKILKMKTIAVTLIKEDDNGDRYAIRINGENAQEWSKFIDEQAVCCYVHGRKFPEVNWVEI